MWWTAPSHNEALNLKNEIISGSVCGSIHDNRTENDYRAAVCWCDAFKCVHETKRHRGVSAGHHTLLSLKLTFYENFAPLNLKFVQEKKRNSS